MEAATAEFSGLRPVAKALGWSLLMTKTRGMGSPIFSFDGKVDIKDKSIAADLRQTAFQMDHVAQYWLDGKELRLDLYRERESDKPHGYVELVLYTKALGDELGYAGRYELIVYDGVDDTSEAKEARFNGKVECTVE